MWFEENGALTVGNLRRSFSYLNTRIKRSWNRCFELSRRSLLSCLPERPGAWKNVWPKLLDFEEAHEDEEEEEGGEGEGEGEEGEEEDGADGDSVPQKRTGSWVSSISWSVSPNTGPIDGIRYHLPHFDVPKLKDQPDDADDSNGDRRFDDVEDEIDGSQSGKGDTGGYVGDDYEDMDDYDG